MLQIFLILILTINSRVYFFKDRFTGCKSPLFQKTFNFLIFKIDFSEACTNLEACAKNTKKTQAQCIKTFNLEMDEFCSSYAIEDRWRRNYCFKIANQNKDIVNDLESDLFKYDTCEKDVKVGANKLKLTNVTESENGNCLDFKDENDVLLTECSDDTLTQEWLLYTDQDSGDVYFDDGKGNCLTGFLVNSKIFTEVCNYCDEDQIFKVSAGKGGEDIFVKNLGNEKYLNLQNDIPNFSKEPESVFAINIANE